MLTGRTIDPAPANHVIDYEQVDFFSGFGKEKTQFFGAPDDRTDELWEKLLSGESDLQVLQYNVDILIFFDVAIVGIVDIDENQAKQFIDVTAEDRDNPGHYTTSLDVFHQLHCLVRLSQKRISNSCVSI